MKPWYPNGHNFINIKDCYNGDDCWMGPYLGWACHGGMDINHAKGEPLWAPMDVDNQWLFNSVAAGHNNNRWRGIRRWSNGDIWAIQTHHLIDLLVKERTPLKAGNQYATAAGVWVGSHEHTHFEFKIASQVNSDSTEIDFDDESETLPFVTHLDPWILFWQIFEDNKQRSGDIRAVIKPFYPARTGERITFSSTGSRAGAGAGELSTYWTFGDGGWSDQAHPEYTFVKPGIYPVTLVIRDGINKAHHTQHITVDGEPVKTAALALAAPREMSFCARPVRAMDVYGLPPKHIPHTLEFVARASRPEPNKKTVHLKNTGFGILPKAVEPGIMYYDAEGWIIVTRKGTGNKQTLDVAVDAHGLESGQYCAFVSIDCPGAINSPQSFRVVLEVPKIHPTRQLTVDDADEAFTCTPYFWVGHRFCRSEKKGFRDFYMTNGGRARTGEVARFTPDLPAGKYRVSLSEQTPFVEGTAFNVRICGKSGEETVRIEPEKSRLIGTFDFNEGNDGFVEVMASGSEGIVAVDAVVFRPISG
jgi:hypothetical protein